MTGARAFVLAIVLLQLGAAVSYGVKRQYALAVMWAGCSLASGATWFIR